MMDFSDTVWSTDQYKKEVKKFLSFVDERVTSKDPSKVLTDMGDVGELKIKKHYKSGEEDMLLYVFSFIVEKGYPVKLYKNPLKLEIGVHVHIAGGYEVYTVGIASLKDMQILVKT